MWKNRSKKNQEHTAVVCSWFFASSYPLCRGGPCGRPRFSGGTPERHRRICSPVGAGDLNRPGADVGIGPYAPSASQVRMSARVLVPVRSI